MNDAPIITDEDVERFLKNLNFRRPSPVCPICTPHNKSHLGPLCWVHQDEADAESAALRRAVGYPSESNL